MFVLDDLLIASLIGGGIGAVTNKKNPLKGALLGAGLGAGGAALAPAAGGLLGAGGATGSTAAGTGLTAGGATGLTAGAGGATGLTATADMLPASSVMHGGLLSNTTAPTAFTDGFKGLTAAGESLPTSLGQPSMWDTAKGFMKDAKPYTDAAGTGMQVAKAMTPQEQPYQPVTSQMPQRQPQEFPFSQMPLQAITDDNERRKKMMQMFAQNAMRG